MKVSFYNATHWVPEYDPKNTALSRITIGKEYPLIYNELEDVWFIEEDDGILSTAYLYHKGYFVKKHEEAKDRRSQK